LWKYFASDLITALAEWPFGETDKFVICTFHNLERWFRIVIPFELTPLFGILGQNLHEKIHFPLTAGGICPPPH
jgi:hypothetical protein